jgi:hypothetical protein
MVGLHRLALDALVQVGTPDAVDVIQSTASDGLLLDRAAARARLHAIANQTDRKGLAE